MQVSSKPHLEKQWDDALSFHLIFTYYLHISKCKITSSLSQFRWFRVWISLRVMVKRNASLRTSSWLPLRNTFFISFSISWNKRSNIMVWLLTSPQTVLMIVTIYGLPWSVYIYLMLSPGYSLPPSWPSLSFPHSVQILVSYQLLKTAITFAQIVQALYKASLRFYISGSNSSPRNRSWHKGAMESKGAPFSQVHFSQTVSRFTLKVSYGIRTTRRWDGHWLHAVLFALMVLAIKCRAPGLARVQRACYRHQVHPRSNSVGRGVNEDTDSMITA